MNLELTRHVEQRLRQRGLEFVLRHGDSTANAHGAGSPYRADSPTNPYGTGWRIVGE